MRLLSFSFGILLLFFLCFQACWLKERPVQREDVTDSGGLSMVINLNQKPRDFGPYQNMGPTYSKAMKHLFFAGWDREHGVELWKTSEGSEECQRVVDVLPGAGSSQPVEITPWKNLVFFSAKSADSQRYLWKSNGTEVGTIPVFPAGSDAAPSDPYNFLSGKNCVFFYAHTQKKITQQIWKTDGTLEGTVPIYTFRSSNTFSAGTSEMPARDGQYIANSICMRGDDLIWAAQKERKAGVGFPGFEFWKSDGTSEGTKCFYESRTPTLIPSGDNVFFFEPTQQFPINSPVELWKTDGTAEGTIKLGGPFTGISFFDHPIYARDIVNSGVFAVSKGLLVFQERGAGRGKKQFWISDGTPQGTHEFQVFSANDSLSDGAFEIMAFLDKILLFSIKRGAREEMWETDWNAKSPIPLSPANRSDVPYSGAISHAILKKHFCFGLRENGNFVIWRTNGKPDGLQKIQSIPMAPDVPVRFIEAMKCFYFVAPGAQGPELWMSNGTVSGTRRIRNAKLEDGSTSSMNLANSGDQLFFSSGEGLWKVVGDKAECVKSDMTCVMDRIFRDCAATDGRFFFMSFYRKIQNDYSMYSKYWLTVTDGTTSGTRMLEFPKGKNDQDDRFPIRSLGKQVLFLKKTKDAKQTILYASDGNQEGTKVLKEFDRNVTLMLPFQDKMFLFLERVGDKSIEIWESDGTVSGTRIFESLNAPDNECQEAVVLGSQLLFTTSEKVRTGAFVPRNLWALNVHPKETYSLNQKGQFDISPSNLAVAGKKVFFKTLESGYDNFAIWSTDGTPAGTKKAYGPDRQQRILEYAPIGDSLLFVISSYQEKDSFYQLWKTDGTPEGTSRVKDLLQVRAAAKFLYWLPYKDRVYFMSEEKNQVRIWESDGTDAGTTDLQTDRVGLLTIAPSDYGFSQRLAACGDRLYFMASDTRHGKELWSCPIPFRKTNP